MKRQAPNLLPALACGVCAGVLLNGRTGYWVRPGLWTFPLSVTALWLAAVLFAWGWRQTGGRLPRAALLILLAGSSALEILRLWRLYEAVYADGVGMFGVCLMIVLPVIYLRRVSSIAQTSRVVLSLLIVGGALMILAIAPQLRIINLQSVSCTSAELNAAFSGQAVLYPELLLPALWPRQEKCGRHAAFRLAFGGVAVSVGMHLLLELFFGAGMPLRENPLHAAAQSGALSIFNRLEWLQLILWTMLVTIKLALYLYAGVGLIGGSTAKKDNNAVGLDRFPFYFLLMLFLCALLRDTDLALLFDLRNAAAWTLAALVLIGGVFRWLLTPRSREQ